MRAPRPMPRPAPVTTATLPSSNPIRPPVRRRESYGLGSATISPGKMRLGLPDATSRGSARSRVASTPRCSRRSDARRRSRARPRRGRSTTGCRRCGRRGRARARPCRGAAQVARRRGGRLGRRDRYRRRGRGVSSVVVVDVASSDGRRGRDARAPVDEPAVGARRAGESAAAWCRTSSARPRPRRRRAVCSTGRTIGGAPAATRNAAAASARTNATRHESIVIAQPCGARARERPARRAHELDRPTTVDVRRVGVGRVATSTRDRGGEQQNRGQSRTDASAAHAVGLSKCLRVCQRACRRHS